MWSAFLLASAAFTYFPAHAAEWRATDPTTIVDDDIARLRSASKLPTTFDISETRFAENGFNWRLFRFQNPEKPDGPLWVVPHDDENTAFDAMIAALEKFGGTGIAVDTGTASSRRQAGNGMCGGRSAPVNACDPNRNFDTKSPLFTSMILNEWQLGHPLIALHTNSPGFSGDGAGGRGDITMLDANAYARGEVRTRSDGYFGDRSQAILDNPDVYAILPYFWEKGIPEKEIVCRGALNKAGINVWHERVKRSDGSLSNFVALRRPEIAYVNFEAEREDDLSIGAKAQGLMINAYLQKCAAIWSVPAAAPDAGK